MQTDADDPADLLESGLGGGRQEDPARADARPDPPSHGRQVPVAPARRRRHSGAGRRPRPGSRRSVSQTSYLPPSDDPLIGTTLAGRYLIQKKLGEGGMGAVYLATHTVLEKQVALKVLHGEFARKPDLVERFMQEAKAASRIRHENVIDISDFGQTPEGLVFFAMELLKGHDLHEEIARARARRAPACRGRGRRRSSCRSARRCRRRTPRASSTAISSRRTSSSIEFLGDRGLRQAARLRHREADRGCRGRRSQADADRHDVRHARVHVAGAGARRAGRSPRRHLRDGLHPVPAGHRIACRSRPTTSWACCRCT